MRNNIPYTTYRDLTGSRSDRADQGVVNETNEKFARVENVRKFPRMIPKELDHEDGELTATQKLKRSAMDEMFGDLIEDMYT